MTYPARPFAVALILTTALVGCSPKKSAAPTSTNTLTTTSGASGSSAAGKSAAATSAGGSAQSTAGSTPVPSAATTKPAKAPATADVCSLLTPAEVSAALGVKAGPGKARNAGPPIGQRLCTWGSRTVPVRNFTLSVQRTEQFAQQLKDAGQTSKKLFQETKKLYEAQGPLTPVPGIGDEAYLYKTTIIALKGDIFISGLDLFGASDTAKTALKTLTAKAVAKL